MDCSIYFSFKKGGVLARRSVLNRTMMMFSHGRGWEILVSRFPGFIVIGIL